MATRSRGTRTSISLTPLIDVVFILLIFFMLASSFRNWHTIHLDVSPPGAADQSGEEEALLVEIDGDALRLAGDVVSLDELDARVRQRLANAPDLEILVQPRADVPLQEVVTVLDRLTAAGASQVSLRTDADTKTSP